MRELIGLIKQRKFKALFMDSTCNTFVQFFRYIFVGGFATVVDWGALWLFYDVFGVYKYLSVAIAFLFGLFTNYILSNHFVFTENREAVSRSSEFMVYFVTGVIGLVFTELFMLLFDGALDIHYMVSKIITTAIVFVWNFGSKKLILERKCDKK